MADTKIPSATDIMTRTRLVLDPAMDILDAIDELVKREVSAAPVVDGEDRLLGLLTEKDCLRVLSTSAYENVYKEGTVGDYMSEIRVVVEASMDLFQTAEQYLCCNFPTLPVVDGERLVGRLSRQEMLRAVRDFIQLDMRQQLAAHEAQDLNRPKSIEGMQQAAANLGRKGLADLFSRKR
ncbi:MAG: CBS domain-containing protein [Deltaproteobacteria bacterium]|nr:CBS domain-containing protein [Deltaproteobacteria bacterium]